MFRVLIFFIGFSIYTPLVAQNAMASAVQEYSSMDIVSPTCACQNEQLIINDHAVEGYTDKYSYAAGEIVKLYAHTKFARLSVSFSKMAQVDTILKVIPRVCAKQQNYTNCSFMYGCHWEPSLYFKLSEDLSPGLYYFKLISNKKTFTVPIVIYSKKAANKLLVIASTNTWTAYNDWGGASFYKFLNANSCQLKIATLVSTQRPNNINQLSIYPEAHLVSSERLFLNWLEVNQYGYDLISDEELDADSSILKNYKVVVINSHGEYYTRAMYDHIQGFVEAGGSLLSMGANQVYWKVVKTADQLECMKFGDQHSLNTDVGGKWRDLGRAESGLLGVEFSKEGLATYAPYQIMQSDHWVFKGTGLKNGDTVGIASKTGRLGLGASGHETDKMTSFSPINTVLLAKGQNISAKDSTDYGVGGAEMTFYEHPAGGAVFSVGSISFNGALMLDKKLSLVTKNVLDNFLVR
ncbi:MAG: N,N-dimethylformamidase beta subunit family domain-containing protein [Bacteroidota bacterium]